MLKNNIIQTTIFYSLPKEVYTYLQTFFTNLTDVENLQLAFKSSRELTDQKTLWTYFIERDFGVYIERIPALKVILDNKTNDNFKDKYKKILKTLLKKQKDEIKKFHKILTEEIFSDPRNSPPSWNDFFLKDILYEAAFSAISKKFKLIKILKSTKKTDKITLQDAIKTFLYNESILDKVNFLVIKEAIAKGDVIRRVDVQSSKKALFLDCIVTRIPETLDSADLENLFLKIENLTQVKIRSCHLYYIPTFLFRMTTLEVLDLSQNHISTIPSEIKELAYLEKFLIANNQLSHLPKELFTLKKLKKLDFGNHQFDISTCPNCDGSWRSWVESKNGNVIHNIPQEIGELTSLIELYMSNIELKNLPLTLGVLKKLEKLYVQNNEINEISEEILNLPNLKRNGLNLIGNPVFRYLPLMILQGKIKLNQQIDLESQIEQYIIESKLGQIIKRTAGVVERLVIFSVFGAVNRLEWVLEHRNQAIILATCIGIPALTYYYNSQNNRQENNNDNSILPEYTLNLPRP